MIRPMVRRFFVLKMHGLRKTHRINSYDNKPAALRG
jgi:hypothetical protein